jgi:hypothetical protein
VEFVAGSKTKNLMKPMSTVMKTILATTIAVALVGCASFYESIGVEPKKPQGNAPSAGATIAVMYYAPAWGPDTNGEEVVYFLKQVMLRSRADEQNRIYFCSIKPDGTDRREIARLWKENPDQYFENFAVAVTMDVNAATKRAAIGVELGERGGIFIVNLDGTGFRSLWPKEWNEDRPTKAGYPTWSPDGKWLAFHEHRFEGGRYLYRIVKCKPDGTDYMPLTAMPLRFRSFQHA